MRVHCDGCGRALDAATALERTWDEETFWFCSEACARAGRHLAHEPYADDEADGGPLTPGELDEPLPRPRPHGG